MTEVLFSLNSLLVVVIAQTQPAGGSSTTMDPVTTIASGWVGTGLLGGILAWLLFVHLPNKDKQLEKIMATHDSQMDAALKAYREELKVERQLCEERDRRLTDTIKENNRALVASLRGVDDSVKLHHEFASKAVDKLTNKSE